MPHADEGRLHAYLDGALHAEDPRAARALESHLEGCADCQALLEFERAVRDEASALLTDALPTAADAPPPWEEILHRAGRGATVAPGAAAAVPSGAAAGGAAATGSAGEPDGTGHGEVSQGRRDRRPPRRFAWLPAGPRMAWAASVLVALGVGWWSHAALGADPFRLGATGEESAILDMVPGGAPEEPAVADEAAEDARGDGGAARETLDDVTPAVPAPAANEAGARSAAGRRDAAGNVSRAFFADTENAPGPPAASDREQAAQSQPRTGERDEAAAVADEVAGGERRTGEAMERARAGRQAASAGADEAVAPDPLSVDSVGEGDAVAREAPQAAPALAKDGDAPEPPAAAVATRLLEGLVDGFRNAEPWTSVDLTEARALLGQTPVGVPGADLVEIAWGAGGRTLRVTQRLPTGERVDLYQWKVAEAEAEAPDGADLADSAARSERAAAARRAQGTPTILTEEGLLVAGSGPLDAAVLRDLLAALEPLEE